MQPATQNKQRKQHESGGGKSLILLRHGQSVWNRDNRFTGWRDIPLTQKGEQDARAAARMMAARGIAFDCAFSSYLMRAIRTMWLVLEESQKMWIPSATDWRLNERHYGALQGREKSAAATHFGEEQLFRWRRGYEEPPPPETCTENELGIPPADGRYDGINIPRAESLAMVEPRVAAFFNERAAPLLKENRRVLIVAHGNSLRALIKRLEGLSAADIAKVNVSTASPIVYSLDDNLHPVDKVVLERE